MFNKNTVGFAVRDKRHVYQITGLYGAFLVAETSSLLLSVEMFPSSKCGISFSYKVEKYVVA